MELSWLKYSVNIGGHSLQQGKLLPCGTFLTDPNTQKYKISSKPFCKINKLLIIDDRIYLRLLPNTGISHIYPYAKLESCKPKT